MSLNEFLVLVEKMRQAQRDFYRSRGNLSALDQAKRMELRVDEACRKLRDGQKELFEP